MPPYLHNVSLEFRKKSVAYIVRCPGLSFPLKDNARAPAGHHPEVPYVETNVCSPAIHIGAILVAGLRLWT